MGTMLFFFFNFSFLTLGFSASFKLRVHGSFLLKGCMVFQGYILIAHFIYSTVGRQLVFSLGPL